MRISLRKYFLLGVMASVLAAPLCLPAQAAGETVSAPAQGTPPRLVFAKGSELWLIGDSTLHGFKIKAETLLVESELEIKAAIEETVGTDLVRASEEAPRISKLLVTVPVKDMTSRIVGLGGKMRGFLKYKEHPAITFEMKGYSIKKAEKTPDTEVAEEDKAKKAEDEASESYTIDAKGLLSMAGVTNEVDLTMTAEIVDGLLHIVGSKDVLMSSHKIEVPVMFFGKIKTEDKIEVHWDLNVSVTTEDDKEEKEKK